jgi:peptidoglycan hydrolase-like protein with peptidoglycan-binding domain
MRRSHTCHTVTTAVSVCAIGFASAIAGSTTVAWADTSPSSYASMLNAERTAHGLPPLRYAGDLAAVAQQWSAHMASTGSLAHNPGLTSQVHNWRAVGENVGEGPTVEDLDAAFMNSAEHRANILDTDYQEFGVGWVKSDGLIWITIDFRDPMSSSSGSTSQPAPASSSPSTPTSSAIPVSTYVPPKSNMLRKGSVGARVAHIQRILGVKHDGMFGPRTRHAVVRFQHQHHLVVDGVVGPKTRAALRRFEHESDLRKHTEARLRLLLAMWPTLEHALSGDGTVSV